MLNTLRNLLRAPEQKASRTAQLIAFESGGRARWTPRDYAALTREGYVKNAIVYRAVKLVAENVGGCALLAEEGGETRDRHPLLDLLARPNPRQDGAQFLENIATHLMIAGNAYVEAVAIDGSPRELHVLRPDRMKLVPGADGWPEAYEYTVAGRTVRFDQAAALPPILHLSLLHPLDDHYGLAPLEAAAVALDLHNAAGAWNKALLDNADTADRTHRQGGLVNYTHAAYEPKDPYLGAYTAKGLPVDVALGKIDTMDLNNGYVAAVPLWYRLLNCGFRLPPSAGTDCFLNRVMSRLPGRFLGPHELKEPRWTSTSPVNVATTSP